MANPKSTNAIFPGSAAAEDHSSYEHKMLGEGWKEAKRHPLSAWTAWLCPAESILWGQEQLIYHRVPYSYQTHYLLLRLLFGIWDLELNNPKADVTQCCTATHPHTATCCSPSAGQLCVKHFNLKHNTSPPDFIAYRLVKWQQKSFKAEHYRNSCNFCIDKLEPSTSACNFTWSCAGQKDSAMKALTL